MNPDDELVARVRRTAGERELEAKRPRSEDDPTTTWKRNLPPATGTHVAARRPWYARFEFWSRR